MITSQVVLDPAFTIAPVPRRLFGSFVEHMGRCVYGGVYDPGHESADAQGLRRDVLDLVRELGVSVVRYPGGNFVSGYDWEDGVGPLEQRPTRLDLAWRSIETNEFGLAEFMDWARKADVEPMMAVNLGTRGVAEAARLLEYANIPNGTTYSDLRIAHGTPEPFDIKLWCLGNEMDGPWQIGHKSADEYGRLAAETAKAMRQVDPSIELVACGSSNPHMPTFGAWEATVLEHTYDLVDYISLHAYFELKDQDRVGFLGAAHQMDEFINGVVATCDFIGAKKRSKRRLKLSFDEWNIWYESRFVGHRNLGWERAPRLIEDEYTVEDAVVVGNLLMSLLRHCDRIGVACLAQLVNVIAPIRSEPDAPAWRQTIFHPFALTARYAQGEVLRVEARSPLIHSRTLGDIPVIDVVATRDDADGSISLFCVNRSEQDSARLDVSLAAAGPHRVVEHLVLGGSDLLATNTVSDPGRVVPRRTQDTQATEEGISALLPPVSWSLIRLAPSTRVDPVDRLDRLDRLDPLDSLDQE